MRGRVLPPRKRLLLFAGGAAGCRTLKTLTLTPAIARLIEVFVWPDYFTTLNFASRFYGAWETGEAMKREQYRIVRAFRNVQELSQRKSYSVRDFNLIPLNYDGRATFSTQKCLDVMERYKIQIIQAACFGRYIPNQALKMVGAELGPRQQLVRPGLAFNIHPGHSHPRETANVLPYESRGKDIIRTLVTGKHASGRPFRAYFMYLTDEVDGGEILGESDEQYLPDWYGEGELSNTADAVNERIRIGVEITAAAYPSVLRKHLVRNVFTAEELLEREVTVDQAVAFGFPEDDLTKAGYRLDRAA